MGRRRWNKKHPDRAKAQQEETIRREEVGDPAARLLALHPTSNLVAVAVGTRINIVDCVSGESVQLQPPPPQQHPSGKGHNKPAAAAAAAADASAAPAAPLPHTHTVRVLAFSPDGRFLLTGADDKTTRLWDATHGSPWRCIAAWRTPKKPSAGCFSHGGTHALFADKFGDVLVGPTASAGGAAAGAAGEAAAAAVPVAAPSTLMGHFCSIVTDVAASPCGRYLASSDKDFKVRISQLPADLAGVSCEIQAYCLGHQAFVSCIGFASNPAAAAAAADPGSGPQSERRVLLSGSGDGTVRVWDYISGQELSSYVASKPLVAKEEEGEGGAKEAEEGAGSGDASSAGDDGDDEGDGDGEEEEGAGAPQGGGDGDGEPERKSKAPPCAPVLSLAVAPDGCTVAVVVEGDDEIQLLHLDWATKSLSLRQRLKWADVRYPVQVAFRASGQLWVVGGVPVPTATSMHVGVAQRDEAGQYAPCTEQALQGGSRAALEARVAEEEAQMAEGGELFIYSQHLRKAAFSEEHMAGRKRQRNDYKETQRLAALRQRKAEEAGQQAAAAAQEAKE